MTRRERKAYNLGKKDGYDIGYAQGLYDGNPINILIDGISNFVDAFTKVINEHPELLAEINKSDEEEVPEW